MKNLCDLTVLITACGAPFMPGLANCIKDNGERNIKLIGVDMSNDNTINSIVDRFYQVPSVDDKTYIDAIFNICKKEKVDIILPFMSKELLLFIENKKRFERIGVKVSVGKKNAVEIANDKLKLYNFLKENGINIAKYIPINNASELDKAFDYLGYPNNAVCIKLTNSSGSRGVRIVDDSKSKLDIFLNEKPNSLYISYRELKEMLLEKEKIPQLMAMEYLPGEEFSVNILADKGNTIYICGRKSTAILSSITQEGELFEDKKIYDLVKIITKLLGIDGNVGFDFKYSKSKKPVLMEINPRIDATMQIYKKGGLNLPYLRIKQLMNEELPKININYNVKMKRRYLEMFDLK